MNVCRFLLGGTFIFSGFVKAVDPYGTFYKLQDYLTAFGIIGWFPSALLFFVGILLAAVEFCVGVYMFLGIRKTVSAWLALLLMLFMTPLTLYLAIADPVSLYEPVYSENGDSIYVMDQLSDSNSSEELWLENIALRDAMKTLTERERTIIQLRYYKNKTQMEIADEIGISQAQVSRLEKGALEHMRKQF